jgi:hypothetical protein
MVLRRLLLLRLWVPCLVVPEHGDGAGNGGDNQSEFHEFSWVMGLL